MTADDLNGLATGRNIRRMAIPEERLHFMVTWLWKLRGYWEEEIPIRIHERDTDEGGTKQWHPEFARWLLRTDLNDQRWRDNPEPRVRTTRAMRKLREKYPREYEVLYRIVILDHTISETQTWLNERAISNKKPERYSREGVLMYMLNGASHTFDWW